MSFFAFVLIFFSVFLHVAWNMISKSTKPSMAFYVLMSATASAIWFPFFLLSDIRLTELPWKFHVFLLSSIVGEVLYVLGLARAYRWNDISLVYPVVRALPVLMIAAVTILFGLGKVPGIIALFGMVLITAGCFLMPLKKFSDFSPKHYISSAIGFILLGAVGTTLYTIFDSSAIKLIREAAGRISILDTLGYLFLIEFGLTLGELIVVAGNRTERALLKKMFCRTLYPVMAGGCSSTAYALVLFAMGYVTNVSYIQAFRQMSLPVGFFAGMLILKEKGTVPKVLGMFLILTGLLCVSLG